MNDDIRAAYEVFLQEQVKQKQQSYYFSIIIQQSKMCSRTLETRRNEFWWLLPLKLQESQSDIRKEPKQAFPLRIQFFCSIFS